LTRAINGSYTNTPGITANPTLTGFPYSVTAANGTRQITPTTWGTWNFNMSVSNTAGSNSCTATLVVNGCGDGIKNCGEACDPNDPTKSGWGNGGCSATCQPINITKPTCTLTLSPTPVCVGNTSTLTRAINGSYTNTPSITANPTLTGFPYSVTAANGTRQITPTTWGTWNFNMSVSNTAGSNSCTATLVVNGCGDGIKNCGEACDPNDPTKSGWGNGGCSATCQPITLSLGQPVIKKELISPATVNYVGETVKWRITVTASGGSISGFEIKDTLPDQLEYVNYSVVTSNGTTVSLQTIAGPVITWKVVGTLQQNQSVVLELTTRVISLPANITKLQNIACVRYNNVQKDCKDAFVPIGRPVIVKTLISPPSGGVSKVGELVKWKITVTASGGSIKDFEIKDILPSQLEYVNYSVLTSNGTTVSLQTISPSVPQTVTRKVMGTLPQNQSVVLELTTRVISLPPALAEIKNVACVQILTGISGNSTSGGTVVALKQS